MGRSKFGLTEPARQEQVRSHHQHLHSSKMNKLLLICLAGAALVALSGAEVSSEEQSVAELSQLREVRAADPGNGNGKGKGNGKNKGKGRGLKKKGKKNKKGRNLKKSDKKGAGKKKGDKKKKGRKNGAKKGKKNERVRKMERARIGRMA